MARIPDKREKSGRRVIYPDGYNPDNEPDLVGMMEALRAKVAADPQSQEFARKISESWTDQTIQSMQDSQVNYQAGHRPSAGSIRAVGGGLPSLGKRK